MVAGATFDLAWPPQSRSSAAWVSGKVNGKEAEGGRGNGRWGLFRVVQKGASEVRGSTLHVEWPASKEANLAIDFAFRAGDPRVLKPGWLGQMTCEDKPAH